MTHVLSERVGSSGGLYATASRDGCMLGLMLLGAGVGDRARGSGIPAQCRTIHRMCRAQEVRKGSLRGACGLDVVPYQILQSERRGRGIFRLHTPWPKCPRFAHFNSQTSPAAR